MARPPSQNARLSLLKDLSVWLAAADPPMGRPKKEVERPSEERVNITESGWYGDSLDRKKWKETYEQGLHAHNQQQQMRQRSNVVRDATCTVCGRCFRRESDRARHKCIEERRNQ